MKGKRTRDFDKENPNKIEKTEYYIYVKITTEDVKSRNNYH